MIIRQVCCRDKISWLIDNDWLYDYIHDFFDYTVPTLIFSIIAIFYSVIRLFLDFCIVSWSPQKPFDCQQVAYKHDKKGATMSWLAPMRPLPLSS